MDNPDLTTLLKRATEGDADAWTSITERFTSLLWSIARSYRLNVTDAGDVVQTTWLRLVENLGRIREPERLAGWLAATARNECFSVLRRSGRQILMWDSDLAPNAAEQLLPAVDVGLLEEERDAALWRALERLPQRCQGLLRVLMAAEPASYSQIADAFSMPIGSIGPTRMRCLAQLRKLLDESDYPFDAYSESRPL